MMLTSLLEPEFIGGEVDLRVNICRGQIVVDDLKQSLNDPKQRLGNYENDLKIRVIETNTLSETENHAWRPKRGAFCFCSS